MTNEVLRQQTDLPSNNFVCTYLTEGNNLVFDNFLDTRDTDYEPYFPTL